MRRGARPKRHLGRPSPKRLYWVGVALIVGAFAFCGMVAANKDCEPNPDPVCVVDWAMSVASERQSQRIRLAAAAVYMRHGRLVQARELLSGTVSYEDQSRLLAELQARMGQHDLAKETFARTARIIENKSKARPAVESWLIVIEYLYLADSQISVGYRTEAHATLRAAEAVIERSNLSSESAKSTAADGYVRLGKTALKIGERETARKMLEKARVLVPVPSLDGMDLSDPADSFGSRMIDFLNVTELQAAMGDTATIETLVEKLVRELEAIARRDPDLNGNVARALSQAAQLWKSVGKNKAGRDAMNRARALADAAAETTAPDRHFTIYLGIVNGYIALEDWDAVYELYPKLGRMGRALISDLVSAAQASKGDLKSSLRTISMMDKDRQASALANAALIAMERR